MSPPSMTGVRTLQAEEREQTISDSEAVGEMLGALEDPDCRKILAETSEESLSANELSTACDLPLSTTYRKLDVLTEVGLLDEQIRISTAGKHTSEYERSVDDIEFSVDSENGVELLVTHRGTTDSARSLVAGAD